MKTIRKFTALIIIMTIVVSLIPSVSLTASAVTTTHEPWTGTTITKNLITPLKAGDSLTAVGWHNIGEQISPTAQTTDRSEYANKAVIQAKGDRDDIGNKEYTGGIYWQIDFSAGDRMKIDKGVLLLSANARYYIQNSATHYYSLRLEFYDEADKLINDSYKKTDSQFAFGKELHLQLSIDYITIPKNAAYVQIWFSNWGSLGGKPFIGDLTAYMTDRTTPEYVSTAVVSDPNTYKIGDKIRLRVEMDEPVIVKDGGTLTVNGGTAVYVGQEIGGSDDVGQYIYYDLEVTEALIKGNHVQVKPESISGLQLMDDAGNDATISTTQNMNTGEVYYDNQYPSLKETHLARVNGSNSLPSQALPEDTVTYSFTFDEGLSYTSLPTLSFSVDGTPFTVNASEGSVGVDGKTLYFTATLPDCAKNGNLVLTGISDLGITDENGNSTTYANNSLSVSEIYYKSIFTVSNTLTHITLASGSSAANFKKAWKGTLKADTGYHLPDAITIVVGDVTLDAARYTYNSETGEITIAEGYITGDVLITASAIENVYNITYEKNGGTIDNETNYTKYTYGVGLTLPTPTRTGYTFGGWYTDKNFKSNEIKSITKTDLGDKTFYAKWTANTYTVKYEKNGGTIANENNYTKYTYGVGLTLPTPTRTGYTFDGWYTDKSFTSVKVTNITETDLGAKTFYAKWTANTYAVTYEKNGGNIENEFLYTGYTYGVGLTLPTPTRTGHTFEGWYTNKNFTSNKVSSITKTDLGAKTFYAKWTANTYTVSYEKNGGTIANESNYKKYTYGVGLTLPTPTRTGYTFDGWYEDQSFSSVRVDVISVTDLGEKKYYAKWNANQYTVTLNAAGGSGGGSITATYDGAMPGITMPARLGYQFKGYFTGKNGEGTAYYDETGTGTKTYDVDGELTLYAKWTPITYDIQFYSMGSYVGTKKDIVYGELMLPSAEELGISREHYTFVGWNIYDEQNWAMYTADNLYPTGLVTEQGQTAYLYAAWLENDKYTITYDANGGEGVPGAEVVYVGDTINLSSDTPTRTDYTFLGWSRDSSAAKPEYLPGGKFTMGNELVTLFAVWEQNPMLSYDPNGGSFASYVESTRPAKGSKVTLTKIEPTRQGYVFAGWALRPDADKPDCSGDDFVMPDKDTVLYAVWIAEKHIVTVNAASGYSVNGIKEAGYEYGEKVEFTVNGAEPKVYVDGVLMMDNGGVYSFTITGNTTVTITDASSKNVIYSANGGTDAPYDSKSYKEGDTATVSSQKPIRTGYKFNGWATSSDAREAEYNAGESVDITGDDIVLYAVWDANKYTIQFNSNGGSGSIAAISAVYDSDIILPDSNGFSMTGQQFAGWALYQGGPVVYSDGASVKNLSADDGDEVTLYAVWRSARTTIRLNPDGGNGGRTETSVNYGGYLPAIGGQAPFKYGYVFEGYYTEYGRNGEQVYDAQLQPIGNYRTQTWNRTDITLELYAGWRPVSYTIRFINGNQYLPKTVNAVFGEAFTLPTAQELGITVPEGSYFAGWSNVAGSMNAYYSDGQVITTGLTGTDGDEITLYAVMLENEKYDITIPASGTGFTVSFDDEELTAPKTVDRYKGGSVTFTVTIAEGYSADNMVVSAEGIALGARTVEGNVYTYTVSNISSDMTINIYGITRKTFQVALNNGTGYSVSPMVQTVTYGGKLEFTVTLARGYETADPVVYVNGVKVEAVNGTEYTYSVSPITSQPVVSISVVQKAQYTVTFMSGGSIYSISTVEEGQKVSAPAAPKRTGYTFDGWYQDESLKTPYNFSAEVNESITLYAKWTAAEYTVEYNKNTTDDVRNMPESQTKSHDTILTLSPEKPTRTGYTFTGWNTRADGSGTSYSAGSELAINVNITLYAQWERNKYIVSLSYGDGVIASIDKTEVRHGDTVTITASVTGEYKNPQITVTPAENAKLADTSKADTYVYTVTGPAAFAVTADSKKVYTVNFYLNNSTEGLYYSQSVIEGSNVAVILPAEPTREGYTFEGWFTAETGGQQVTSDTTVSGDMNVYAHWKANIFTVTPAENGEGYTVTSSDSPIVEYGGDYTFTVTIAEHYNASSMRVYANGVLLEGSADNREYTFTINNITADQIISITGVELDKHTVIYNVDGRVYQTVQTEYNTLLAEPAKPVKEGKTFKGWSDGERIWDFSTDTVTEDITLYAVWEGNTFIVTPAANGEGYTVTSSDSPIVDFGGSYTFTVTIAEHYNVANMRVYANGILLEGSADDREYTFTINNITADQIISITGVELDKHTVTYMIDGQLYQTVQTEYNTLLAEPAEPVKEGKTFKGWSDGKRIWDFSTDTVTEDITLYAVWEGNTFTVTPASDGEGYTVTSSDSPIVDFGGSYTFTITLAEHYNADNMRVYANGILLEGNADGRGYTFTVNNITADQIISIMGVELDKHTVIYNVDGRVYQTVQTEYNTLLAEPAKPVKEGKTFKGWSDGKKIWDFSTDTVTEDITLYAVWEGNTFTVTPASDGEGYTVTSSDSPTVDFGGSYTFTITLAEHYNADNMRVYANGILLEGNADDREYTFTINNITADQIISITGVKLDIHSVVYKVDGGVYYETQADYGTGLIAPVPPVKDGMEFAGWYNNDIKWDFDTDKVTGDIVLDAHWTERTFSVTLPPETDSYIVEPDSANPEPIVYGDSYIFTVTIKEGYNAENMIVLANGAMLTEIDVNGNVYTYLLENISENKVITVKGIENDTFGISYNANTMEYVGNLPDGQVKIYGIDITLSEIIPERKGYSFEGWSDSADGEVKYQSGGNYTENADVTLYAVWKPMEYSVSFETNGGTINSGEIDSYTYGTGAVLPTDVTKENSRFLGWYDNAALEGARVEEILPTDTEDKTYYAGWKIGNVIPSGYSGVYDGAEHTISFNAPDGVSLISCLWYFKADNAADFIPIAGVGNSVSVKDVSQSGAYYCSVEAMEGGYITRFDTETARVEITPYTLSVEGKSITKLRKASIDVNELYSITGIFGDEALTLDNVSVIVRDEKQNTLNSLKNVTATAGTYTVDITYDGFAGDGSENYTGSGIVTSTITVSGNVSSGGGGGGGVASPASKPTASPAPTPDEEATNKPDIEPTNEPDTDTNNNDNNGNTNHGDSSLPFTDVNSNDWFYDDVEYARAHGFMQGMSESTFAPGADVTRAMFVTVIYRLEGEQETDYSVTFKDVLSNAYYADAVAWAAERKIVEGYSDVEFAPDGLITREQMAAIIYRYANYKGYDTNTILSLNYTDTESISDYAVPAVMWATENGILSGYTNNVFAPQDSATRAQTAAVFRRFDEKFN